MGRTKSAVGTLHDQLYGLYGPDVVKKFAEHDSMAFISMHLHGRLFPKLITKALDGQRFEDYQFFLGDTVPGALLGYNFGDGMMHASYFVNAMQQRCKFDKGECLQVWINSCPLFGSEFEWCIRDASRPYDTVYKGQATVSELTKMQPF